MLILKELKSMRLWRDFSTGFFGAVGVFTVGVSLVAPVAPNVLLNHPAAIWILLGYSLVYALWHVRPQAVSQEYGQGYSVDVVVGDLFKQQGNSLIGMTDTFDVEIPNIIQRGSIQGQFLERIWNGDVEDLKRRIAEGLNSCVPVGDITKPGNTKRYPIGTVLPIHSTSGAIYFCVAYSKMDENNKAQAHIEEITHSLFEVWESTDRCGNGSPIFVPLIGQGQSRIAEMGPEAAIRLIAMTFVLRSNRLRVANSLKIVLRPEDVKKINLREFAAFLRTLPGAK
jgi:hypothetical protein